MTSIEIFDAVEEYQTTDSISRKSVLFNLLRQKSWEVWFSVYQHARKLYLKNPLPTVENILNRWGPVKKNLKESVNGYAFYTQLNIHRPSYRYDDEIVLSGLTEEGINIGLPSSIEVTVRMFDPDYLDYYIREIKPLLHYKLSDVIYSKENELKQLQDAYRQTENPILSKLNGAEPGTTLWYERWCDGRKREATEVKFVGIEKRLIIVEINGTQVSFDRNGTQTSESDYTSDCMLFPASNHKRWDDVTYVPASKQQLLYK